MACPMRSHGILATLATIKEPTMSSAGPTAYGGMLAARQRQQHRETHASVRTKTAM
jgi:hypothetical protein